jgi:hypothetical protein
LDTKGGEVVVTPTLRIAPSLPVEAGDGWPGCVHPTIRTSMKGIKLLPYVVAVDMD